MAKKKSGFKSFFEFIKKLRKTERGKGILFLGFYFFFFLVLIIFIRISANNPVLPVEYDQNNNSGMYTYDKIFAGNYDFTYTINVDGNVFVYTGEKNNDVESFTLNGITYCYDGVDYYTLDSNNIWVTTSNPYMYPDFMNFTRLGEVIVNATYISKTEFGDGRVIFNYLVSSNSMIKVIEDIAADIDEVPNSVVFTGSGENLHLDKIELDLTSYGIFKGICSNSFKITLEYSDFGGNNELVSPIG